MIEGGIDTGDEGEDECLVGGVVGNVFLLLLYRKGVRVVLIINGKVNTRPKRARAD